MTNYQIIHNTVLEVRKYIKAVYIDKEEPWNKTYCGWCNEASELFMEKIETKFKKRGSKVETKRIHGEQAHNPISLSRWWPAQHTWCSVTVDNETWYVDCTSQQFQEWYEDIPDYYISKKKPKWYYSDSENLRFHGFTGWLEKKIRLNDGEELFEDYIVKFDIGIISYIQRYVWAPTSDIVRKLLGRNMDL